MTDEMRDAVYRAIMMIMVLLTLVGVSYLIFGG